MTLSDNLVKINLLRKGLDELRPLNKQAEEKLWEKLRLEWNYNSNHIEGNTLTYNETKLLLLFEKTTGDHEKREYDEMQAHDVAIHLIRDWAADKDRDLTEADIKNLNKIILVKPYWKEALTYDGQPTRRLLKVGDYKEYPNSVRLKSGEMFHYASPEETPRLMQELIDWYRTSEIQHPLYLAAEFHYKFIRIHPFDDGNGRIARLLVNYVLMKNGYTPIIIKSIEKENYITALQKADSGDKVAFPNYMAEQLKWSLELEEKAAKGENLDEPDDLEKEISLLKRDVERENKLTAKGLRENIYYFIENNIISLFELLDKNTAKLSDFFLENSRTIHYEIEAGGINPYTKWDPIRQNMEEILTLAKSQNFKFTRVLYNYEFRNLKTRVDGGTMEVFIDIYFDPAGVKIKTLDLTQPKWYAYSKTISDDEKYNLIKKMIKDIINRIKEAK